MSDAADFVHVPTWKLAALSDAAGEALTRGLSAYRTAKRVRAA
jgi:hypothetical protein